MSTNSKNQQRFNHNHQYRRSKQESRQAGYGKNAIDINKIKQSTYSVHGSLDISFKLKNKTEG